MKTNEEKEIMISFDNLLFIYEKKNDPKKQIETIQRIIDYKRENYEFLCELLPFIWNITRLIASLPNKGQFEVLFSEYLKEANDIHLSEGLKACLKFIDQDKIDILEKEFENIVDN